MFVSPNFKLSICICIGPYFELKNTKLTSRKQTDNAMAERKEDQKTTKKKPKKNHKTKTYM